MLVCVAPKAETHVRIFHSVNLLNVLRLILVIHRWFLVVHIQSLVSDVRRLRMQIALASLCDRWPDYCRHVTSSPASRSASFTRPSTYVTRRHRCTRLNRQWHQMLTISSVYHNVYPLYFYCQVQGRSQREGHGCMSPRHRRSVFVTAPLVFFRVSIFCPWTPLGTSVHQNPLVFPLSKVLATPLANFISTLINTMYSRYRCRPSRTKSSIASLIWLQFLQLFKNSCWLPAVTVA